MNFKTADTEEARIQQDCFMWHWNSLPEERNRLILIHNNPRNAIDGAILKGMGLRKGASDLLYLRKMLGCGICLPHYLECKTPTGVQKPEQKIFQKRVLELGWRYDIFRSLYEFQALISGVFPTK